MADRDEKVSVTLALALLLLAGAAVYFVVCLIALGINSDDRYMPIGNDGRCIQMEHFEGSSFFTWWDGTTTRTVYCESDL